LKTYNGKYLTFYCSNLADLEVAIRKGLVFRVHFGKSDEVCYYKAEPYRVAPHRRVPTGVVSLEKVNMIARDTNGTHEFYKIIESDKNKDRIFYGEELKKMICFDLYHWAKDMQVDSLTAFRGKALHGYLASIPREIYIDIEFFHKMKKYFAKGIVENMRANSKKYGVADYKAAIKKSNDLFNEMFAFNAEISNPEMSMYAQKQEKLERHKEGR